MKIKRKLWKWLFMVVRVLYSHLHHHSASQRHNIIDRRMNKRRMIKTQEGRHKKTSLEKYSLLSLLQGFERVVQGLHVRGWWRPNINFIFWPLCYDRHVVSFLFSCCWGLLHRGFPRVPSVGCGLSYHIWSLAVWNSTGNCLGTPNSTELINNSTPTRSPTGSLKLDV